MTSNNRRTQDRVERRLRGVLREELTRAIRPYKSSADEKLQRIGQELESKIEGLLSFRRLETAKGKVQAFIANLEIFKTQLNAYNRTVQQYEQAREHYERTASELGLSLSLPSTQERPAQTRPSQYRYPFTQEQRDQIKRTASEAYATLVSQPEYQNQNKVPLYTLGQQIRRNIFGDPNIGRRDLVIAMMISHSPEDYGFTITGERGRRYVSLVEMPSNAVVPTVVASPTQGAVRRGRVGSLADPIKQYLRSNGPSRASVIIASMPTGTNENTVYSALRRLSQRGELVHESRVYKLPETQSI